MCPKLSSTATSSSTMTTASRDARAAPGARGPNLTVRPASEPVLRRIDIEGLPDRARQQLRRERLVQDLDPGAERAAVRIQAIGEAGHVEDADIRPLGDDALRQVRTAQ